MTSTLLINEFLMIYSKSVAKRDISREIIWNIILEIVEKCGVIY